MISSRFRASSSPISLLLSASSAFNSRIVPTESINSISLFNASSRYWRKSATCCSAFSISAFLASSFSFAILAACCFSSSTRIFVCSSATCVSSFIFSVCTFKSSAEFLPKVANNSFSRSCAASFRASYCLIRSAFCFSKPALVSANVLA